MNPIGRLTSCAPGKPGCFSDGLDKIVQGAFEDTPLNTCIPMNGVIGPKYRNDQVRAEVVWFGFFYGERKARRASSCGTALSSS